MLAVQVDYWKQEEAVRSNKANEALKQAEINEIIAHNLAVEKETVAHNIATEKETQRSNKANEIQKANELAENVRAHKANEALTKKSLENDLLNIQEGIRSHKAQEQLQSKSLLETQRHNIQSESIQSRQADIAQQQATASGKQAEASLINANASTQQARASLINAGNKTREVSYNYVIGKEKNEVQERTSLFSVIGNAVGSFINATSKLMVPDH